VKPRERVLAVLEGETPDMVPLYLDGWFQPGIHVKLVKEYHSTSKINLLAWLMLRAYVRPLPSPAQQLLFQSYIGLYDAHFLAIKLGTDLLAFWLPAVSPHVTVDLRTGSYTDWFGARHFMKDFVDQRDETFRLVKSENDLERLEKPDFHSLLPKLLVAPLLRRFKDFASFAWITGPWETAHALYPLSELLVAIYRNRLFVEKLLDFSVEFWVGAIEEAARLGMDGIVIGDDYGTQIGPMISPKHHSELVLPRLRSLVQTAKKKGLYALLHSCGNISPLLDSLIECGFDAIHPLQPGAMNTLEIVEKYKGKFVACTGFDVQRHPFCTPEEVSEYTRTLIEKAFPHLILAPTNAVVNDTPPENLFAFIRARRKFGCSHPSVFQNCTQ
jgi:uroporphyrinogen decarboxylase